MSKSQTLKSRGESANKMAVARDIGQAAKATRSVKSQVEKMTVVISKQAPSRHTENMFTMVEGDPPTFYVTQNGRQFKFEGTEVK